MNYFNINCAAATAAYSWCARGIYPNLAPQSKNSTRVFFPKMVYILIWYEYRIPYFHQVSCYQNLHDCYLSWTLSNSLLHYIIVITLTSQGHATQWSERVLAPPSMRATFDFKSLIALKLHNELKNSNGLESAREPLLLVKKSFSLQFPLCIGLF